MTKPDGELTRLLQAASTGDRNAYEDLLAAAYPELERVAGRQLAQRFGARAQALTIEPAALVNEAFIKIASSHPGFENRRHFYAFMSQVMLRTLADYDRARRADKRGGDKAKLGLTGLVGAKDPALAPAALDVESLLSKLEELDSRKAEIVKLRFFWGMETKEIAELLDISSSTVERDWRFSKAWLAAAYQQIEVSRVSD